MQRDLIGSANIPAVSIKTLPDVFSNPHHKNGWLAKLVHNRDQVEIL